MNHETVVGILLDSSNHPGWVLSAIGIDGRNGLGFFRLGGLRPENCHVQCGGRKPGGKGAFAYNPATMGFHDRTSVSLGTLFIGPNFSVDTATGHHDGTGVDWVTAPLFQAALRVHDQWRIGLGINVPFGLETRWETGTFPELSGGAPVTVAPGVTLPLPFGAHPTNSKLETLALVPTLAYKVNEDLSIAVGLDYYKTDTAQLDFQLIDISGDGDAWGWNTSVLYRRGALSLGAVYHSSATSELKGHYTPLNPTLVFLGMVPPAHETGQNKDHFSASVPNNDRRLFSLGVGQGWASRSATCT